MKTMKLSLGVHFGMTVPKYAAMLQMVEKGRLRPGELVTRTISLSKVAFAMKDMSTFPGVGVAVIDRF
jgi:Zn-dependent alcohol dehydrogenase